MDLGSDFRQWRSRAPVDRRHLGSFIIIIIYAIDQGKWSRSIDLSGILLTCETTIMELICVSGHIQCNWAIHSVVVIGEW